MHFHCIHGFCTYKVSQPKIQPTTDHVRTITFTAKKNPCVNGSAQFKHVVQGSKVYEKEEEFRHGGNVGKIFLAFLRQGGFLKAIGYLRNSQLLNYNYYNHPHKMSESSNLWNTMANIPRQIF